MKKHILSAAVMAVLPAALCAQTALDAYQAGQGDLRGTARFMSMGGAFTALGGDLTTLGQNPAGIGIYRNSEVGITLDINMQSVTSDAAGMTANNKQTKAFCNNVGYIGAVNLRNSVMPFFQWGVTYGRAASFDRRYSGTVANINSSATNYVASFTASEGWTPEELSGYTPGYSPFNGSYAPWTSIMMYNSYGINSANDQATDYEGLYNGTAGTATFDVEEHGYVDEYNINFGGNIMNLVYWGMGFGITDIEYSNLTYYTESFSNATIPDASGEGRATGGGAIGLESWKHIYGTGFNFKIGAIIRPINELRIGLAVHTPTYYNLSYQGWAQNSFNYNSGIQGVFPDNNTYGTSDDWFTWKYRTPWRLMAGVAGVIGGKGIISADYEYRPYDQMNVQDGNGNAYSDVNGDVKTYYQAQNILRLGAEYRLTTNWSLRAGYSYASAPFTQATRDGMNMMYTSGPDDTETQMSFSMDNETQYVTCGIGFHSGPFYADAAYVWRHRSSTWQAFTNYDGITAPRASLSDNQSNIVLSVGFKF